MADRELTPVHDVRPTTQALKIPARFIPAPTVEPGHTFASVTDHISSIVLRKKMPLSWSILFALSMVGSSDASKTIALAPQWLAR